jgi:hypothetical protein
MGAPFHINWYLGISCLAYGRLSRTGSGTGDRGTAVKAHTAEIVKYVGDSKTPVVITHESAKKVFEKTLGRKKQ